MKRTLTSIFLIVFLLTIMAIFLVQSGVPGEEPHIGGSPTSVVPVRQSDQTTTMQDTLSAKATATFGAEQFYLQLTAIAGTNQ
jgi:hypothetical protein